MKIFGSMKPARDVGGDFFDVLSLEDGRLGLVVADVSDKGVPAALFMMSSRTLLKGAAIGLDSPGKVLSEVNQLLQEENDAAMFVTVFYATFNPATGELAYANGGHNTPLVVHADGSSTAIPPTGGVALGVVPEFTFDESSITLQPGDRVVLYTDGVTEAENDQGDQFELARLCEIFANGTPMDARSTNAAVLAAVEAFAGDAPQFDDVTCLTLRRTDP